MALLLIYYNLFCFFAETPIQHANNHTQQLAEQPHDLSVILPFTFCRNTPSKVSGVLCFVKTVVWWCIHIVSVYMVLK